MSRIWVGITGSPIEFKIFTCTYEEPEVIIALNLLTAVASTI
jgi:hypothetical protein